MRTRQQILEQKQHGKTVLTKVYCLMQKAKQKQQRHLRHIRRQNLSRTNRNQYQFFPYRQCFPNQKDTEAMMAYILDNTNNITDLEKALEIINAMGQCDYRIIMQFSCEILDYLPPIMHILKFRPHEHRSLISGCINVINHHLIAGTQCRRQINSTTPPATICNALLEVLHPTNPMNGEILNMFYILSRGHDPTISIQTIETITDFPYIMEKLNTVFHVDQTLDYLSDFCALLFLFREAADPEKAMYIFHPDIYSKMQQLHNQNNQMRFHTQDYFEDYTNLYASASPLQRALYFTQHA